MSHITETLRVFSRQLAETPKLSEDAAKLAQGARSGFLSELWSGQANKDKAVGEPLRQAASQIISPVLDRSQMSLAERINLDWGIKRSRTLSELETLELEMKTAPMAAWTMKADAYPSAEPISNWMLHLEPGKSRLMVLRDDSSRFTPELRSYELTKISPLDTEFPVSVIRETNGQEIMMQERFGRSLGDRILWLNRRVFGEKPKGPYDSLNMVGLTNLAQNNPLFRQKLEETLAWRQVLGVADNHPFNIAVRLQNRDVSLANIDMESMKSADRHLPRFQNRYYEGAMLNAKGRLDLSPLTISKLVKWRQMLHDETVRPYVRQHLSENEIDAMSARTGTLIARKRLPWY